MYRLRAVLRSPIVRCSPLISKQKFVTTQQIFNKIDEVKPTDHDIIEDFLKEDKNGEDVGEDDLLMKDFLNLLTFKILNQVKYLVVGINPALKSLTS